MVRAILAGQKTQTRRIMKPQPTPVDDEPGKHWWPADAFQSMVRVEDELQSPKWTGIAGDCCPHGKPGDRLWVRETWGVVSNAWDDDGNICEWNPDRDNKEIHELPFGQGYYSGHVIYAADGEFQWAGDDDGGGEPRSAWHPSIHMPRAASRITLEITGVRVERLRDITESDAEAEGCTAALDDGPTYYDDFASLWRSINGTDSWDANPWVWVIEFKRVTP
jgi:hypothetical protein